MMFNLKWDRSPDVELKVAKERIDGMSDYIDSMLYAMLGNIGADRAKASSNDPNIVDAPWELAPPKLPAHKLRWETPGLMGKDKP